MGQLVDGTWQTKDIATRDSGGKFIRRDAQFRNWITKDGRAGPSGDAGFPAELGRYHLYVSNACPWAHRALIFRQIKGLADHISTSAVHPDGLDQGWSFDTDDHGADGDDLFGSGYAHELYTRADPNYSGRVTVPILWDKKTGRIVSNESSEIIRMFNSAFDDLTGNTSDFWPLADRDAIEVVNDRVYNTVNNGVYKCGFSSSQAAYDEAIDPLFETLDWLEDRLTDQRYLMGDKLTEADWRLFTTLVRFDPVYFIHFKCSRKRISDYPSLSGYLRDLFQMPGIAGTVNMAHIIRHYFYSHDSVNPNRIIPSITVPDLTMPHGRTALSEA